MGWHLPSATPWRNLRRTLEPERPFLMLFSPEGVRADVRGLATAHLPTWTPWNWPVCAPNPPSFSTQSVLPSGDREPSTSSLCLPHCGCPGSGARASPPRGPPAPLTPTLSSSRCSQGLLEPCPALGSWDPSPCFLICLVRSASSSSSSPRPCTHRLAE